MSETSIFGDDSMVLKESFSNPRVVAEAYELVSNTYGDACNEAPELKDYLSTVNSEIGSLQGSLDNMKASDVSEFRNFTVTEHNGHMIFESYTPEIESGFHAETIVESIQNQLAEALGEIKLSAPSGNSGEPEDEPEGDDDESTDESTNEPTTSDSDLEGPFQQLADCKGLGEKTVSKVRKAVAVNGIDLPSPDEIDMEVSVTERYDSLDDVPAETVAELSPEQISELQG